MIDKYKCPECDGEMPNSKNINNKLLCSACSYSVEVISGVPVFFSSVDSEKPEENTTGLSERLFSTPQLYKIFAAAKSYLFPDNSVGISEYISNKDVIDIGCGPSLNMKHSEYNIDDARSFAGVDVSLRFVLNAKKENPADMFDFAVASIDKLPYSDKSFDTSIISFVIHHVPIDKMKVMEEVLRVTKSNIIIFDHLRSDSRFKSTVQMLYWKYFDGGCNYLSNKEWQQFLKSVEIVKSVQTGAIFGHVMKFVCKINQ